MKKVKVKVTDTPNGHRHEDREVEEGEVLEVWERQAAFLEERGVAVPYSGKKKKSRRSRKKAADEDTDASDEESADESPNEGADETPDQ